MIEFFESTNNPNFKLKEHVLFPDTAFTVLQRIEN